MAFSSGPVTIQRFFITADAPRNINDEFIQQLNDAAFGRYGTATPDGREVGWITPVHLFDTDFAVEKVAYDRFAYFQMRLDNLAIPGSLRRSYIRQEESLERETNGDGGLSKKQKQLAKERADARATEESRKGVHRRISSVPVLMDLPARTLYFGSHSSLAADKLIVLFRDTFGCTLESAVSEQVAFRIMDAAGDPRSIEDAHPFHLVPEPGADDDDWRFDNRSFFGREFLTWLWYLSEEDSSTFDTAGKRIVTALTSMLRLDCDFKQTGSDLIRCDNPAAAPESRAALRIGKQPAKAGLIIAGPKGQYSLVLDGTTLAVSGLRLPEPENNEPRAILEERFDQITDAVGLLDSLFGLFLGRRASSGWSRELSAMKAWARGHEPASDRSPTRQAAAEPHLQVIMPLHGQEA